jgi:hypothetical protein
MTPALLQALLFLAPGLLLWALLAIGRYPGEGIVGRLARRPRRRRALARVCGRASAPRAQRPRNLLACSLAGRAPPVRSSVRSASTT